jgi:hypothetical protein
VKAVARSQEHTVEYDRRGVGERRNSTDRRKESQPVAVERRMAQRRKVPRRRQIDPTTCERDYSPDEVEFMHAIDAYKRSSGRMFPTCSEILEVILKLGYVKLSAPGDAVASVVPATDSAASEAATSVC